MAFIRGFIQILVENPFDEMHDKSSELGRSQHTHTHTNKRSSLEQNLDSVERIFDQNPLRDTISHFLSCPFSENASSSCKNTICVFLFV